MSNQRKIILAAMAIAVVLLAGLALLFGGSPSPQAEPVATQESTPKQPESIDIRLEPTPAPEPWILFEEDASEPLPVSGYRHALGEPLRLHGTVRSNYPLKNVSVTITCAYNNDNEVYPYEKSVNLKKAGIYSYELTDSVTDDGISLAELVDFTQLQVGVNTLKLFASCQGIRKQELARIRFYVVGNEWIEMKTNQLNGSYDELMEFFGTRDRFLYRFQLVNGRYTMADPDWEETYITTIPGYPESKEWRVHKDTLPYLEKVFSYLDTTYVRVHGTNGDSGVIPLSSLILEYNGCFVSRYTSSLKAVSAHSFGTAIDINASMTPNKNIKDNVAVINNDVSAHLSYEGIQTEDSLRYYAFSYDGSYENCDLQIPQTCVNYLLYELAFYRAGYKWAHYYSTTSDAMHFTLGEQVSGADHDGKGGLRKVFQYIDEE